MKLPSQVQVWPSLVPCSPQLRSQNSPAQLPSQVQEPAAQEPAARAAVMFVWLPRPLQLHSVSQSRPMSFPVHVQESAEQEFASRAAVMLLVEKLPRAPQSGMGHSVSQNSPM